MYRPTSTTTTGSAHAGNLAYLSNVLKARKMNGNSSGAENRGFQKSSISSNKYKAANVESGILPTRQTLHEPSVEMRSSVKTTATGHETSSSEDGVKLFEFTAAHMPNVAYVKRNSNYFKYVLNQQRKRHLNAVAAAAAANNTSSCMTSNRSSNIKDEMNTSQQQPADEEKETSLATNQPTHHMRLLNHEIVMPPIANIIKHHSPASNVLLVRRLRLNKVQI